jgi:hypothetical protein
LTDVFISYSREDRPRVQLIAEALTNSGLKVWWDPHIKTGSGFREEIQAALSETQAVIVIWSQHSVTSRFVCDEADEGAAREILFPALVDLVDIPLGFRQIQTADLTHWRGKTNDRGFRDYINVVTDFVMAHKSGRTRTEESEAAAPPPPPPPPPPPKPAPKPARAPAKRQAPVKGKPGRTFITGQRLRLALLWRSIALAILIAGAFGGLAYAGDFLYKEFRPLLIGAIAILVFVSRFATFEADRGRGAASLRLLSRSYAALLLFSLVSIAPLILEGRLYTEALRAVQIKGIEGADINGVDFDSTGKLLATASDDGTARVWDAMNGVEKARLAGHTNWVWKARFSPDSKWVVTASRDLTARVWNARTGALKLTLTGHTASVLDAAFSPSGTEIATASADQTVRIWNAETGELVRTLSGHEARVNALAVSPDGQLIASADGAGMVRLWRWSSGETAAVLQVSGANWQDIAFDRSGKRLAAAAESGEAHVWDVAGKQQVAAVDHKAKLFAVEFVSRDELATGGIDSVARIWKLSTGEIERELAGHKDAVRDMAVSPDGKYLATGSRDNTARIWDLSTGLEVQIVGHTKPAFEVPFVLDQPPVIFASRAPTSAGLIQNPEHAGYLMAKGVVLGFGLLIIGLLIKGLMMAMKQRAGIQWSVVTVFGLGALYILALMLTDLPIEATYLWIIAGFVPAAIFSGLMWIISATIGGTMGTAARGAPTGGSGGH